MSLMNALWPWHMNLGNPIEDGKKAQMDHRLDSLRLFPGCENIIKEMRTYTYQPIKPDFIEGECSVVEIDGKKLLEEIK